VDEPGFHSAILSEKMLKNQPLAGPFRTFPERSLVRRGLELLDQFVVFE